MRVWSSALPSPPVPSPRILRVVQAVWTEMRSRPEQAGSIVSHALRAARTLGAKERPVAGDMLLGMIRHERALARLHEDPVSAWLQLAEQGVPDLPDPPEAYAIALSLPDWLAEEWWARLGPEAAIHLACVMGERAPVCLRVLREPVSIPVRHRREGATIWLEERANVLTFPDWREGRVEVQDAHSQRIADQAFPGEGRRVLDLCAGAGGKSLAMAALGAKVQAWDVRPAALRELSERAARCGLEIEIAPPEGHYDTILIDAPCSGTGVLRRHPENRWKLGFPVEAQVGLLERSQGHADRIVYATCSLARRENEEAVRTLGEPAHEETMWPESGGGDGFYVAEVGGG